MPHPSEGTLRRLQDDPRAVRGRDHLHLEGCAACRSRAAEVAADAGRAAQLLAAAPGPAGLTLSAAEVESALLRARARLRSAPERPSPAWRLWPAGRRPIRRPARRLLVAGTAVPVLLAGLVITASASGWFTIFQPQQFAAVTVSAKELTGLPDLTAYGRMVVKRPQVSDAADGVAAAGAAGLRPLRIPGLPASVPRQVHWASVSQSTASFTFDRAAAGQAARKAGQPAPVFPAGIDGSTVTVTGGPGVVAVFGAGSTASVGTMPALVIAEGRTPAVATDGVSLQRLKDFILSQPGVSPQLATQVRAIGDPASTLPVPVLVGRMSAHQVDVNGAPGLEVGDSTGLGAGVIWQRAGLVYAVGGTLTDTQALAIARALR